MRLVLIKMLFLALTLFVLSCGEGVVNVDDKSFEPKIVLEGYISPHQKVKEVRISRNFPLNQKIDIQKFIISDASVVLTDLESQQEYPLTYHPGLFAYEYQGNDLEIEHGKSYQLDVAATIDGKNLFASSTTTVPLAGFAINEELSELEPMAYREMDENNNLKNFKIAFSKSSNIDFYVLSIIALDASLETFIEDNPLGIERKDLEDDDDLFAQFKYTEDWLQSSFGSGAISRHEILWFFTWFYGRYRAIMYAGDQNFKYYFTTHEQVQDIDGNLYEPKFNIDGDGIGVFGSFVADTVYFEITR